MTDEPSPEQQFAAEDAETMVPRLLLTGATRQEAIAALVRDGWGEGAAALAVGRVALDVRRYRESPESRRALVAEARRQFVGGLLVLGLGVVLAAMTAALVFFGLVVFGAMSGAAMLGQVAYGGLMAQRGWARWGVYRREW